MEKLEIILPAVLPARLSQQRTPFIQASICPRCKGAGYVRYNVEFGHPDFGKPKLCNCRMAEVKMKILPTDYQDYSFETWPATGDRSARDVALAFADGTITAVRGLWLYSRETGTGKTGLACCILRWAIEHRELGRYVEAKKMYLLGNAIATGNAEQDALQPYYDAPWLVVDDLGVEKASDAAIGHWLTLLEKRRGKRTVFTSNFSYEQLRQRWRSAYCDELLIERVIDRLGEQYYPQVLTGKIRQRCY